MPTGPAAAAVDRDAIEVGNNSGTTFQSHAVALQPCTTRALQDDLTIAVDGMQVGTTKPLHQNPVITIQRAAADTRDADWRRRAALIRQPRVHG